MPLSSVKFIVVSAGIHIFILSAFVFTFRNITEPFKPTLIFLGSILKGEDVIAENETQTASQKPIAMNAPHLIKTHSQERAARADLNKPWTPGPAAEATKPFTKSTFPTIEKPSGQAGSANKDLDGDMPAAVPYRPLKLYSDDQN